MRRERLSITPVILFLLVISSCASLKRENRTGNRGNANFDSGRFYEEVRKYNITNESFRFDRVRVGASINGENVRISGNLRYSSEGKLLFSARTIGNIEIARLYIDREKVVLIDRINRQYNSGSTERFLMKYNLLWEDVIVLFGDLPGGIKGEGRMKCNGGLNESYVLFGGREVILGFDCIRKKLTGVKIESLEGLKGGFSASYSELNDIEGVVFPGLVNFSDDRGNLEIELKMEKYRPFEGDIKMPDRPRGYEIIDLK